MYSVKWGTAAAFVDADFRKVMEFAWQKAIEISHSSERVIAIYNTDLVIIGVITNDEKGLTLHKLYPHNNMLAEEAAVWEQFQHS